MKYDGKELVEMTPEDWDGKSRDMIVWTDITDPVPYRHACIRTVIGYHYRNLAWVVSSDKRLDYWTHCAEIPEEPAESLKDLVETTPFEDALLTRINELKEEIADLKEENEKLKNELNERISNELRNILEKEMDLVYEERYLD